MKKQQLFSTLALSSLILSMATPIYANEATAGAETTVATTDTPVVTSPVDVPINQPVTSEDSQPKPVEKSTEEKPVDEEPETSVVTSPIDTPVTNPTTEKAVEKPKETPADNSTKVVNQPTQSPTTGTTEDIKKPELDLPTEPTIIPTVEAPVITEAGATIVSTQDSQVIVKEATGELRQVSPESIGATKQANGTIAIKDNTGKLQVLPATGDANTAVISAIGLALFSLGGVLTLKKSGYRFDN